MAKSENQKLKLLYLQKIIFENTDEEHGLTLPEIITELEKYDIQAERKSLYSDIELLARYGFEITRAKNGKRVEYKLTSGRKYQLAEVKLMVDAVQSTRFITKGKTHELIKKLEKEVSIYEAKQLQRTVFIEKRSKTYNESIYISIDTIYRAIQSKKQISFNYYEWYVSYGGVEKVFLRAKKDGKPYQVSPWYMIWDDEKYYLIAYDHLQDKIKHFRVDKIKNVEITSIPQKGTKAFNSFDVSTYVKQTFGMFGGDTPQEITMRIDNRLIGVIKDRFGEDFLVMRADEARSDIVVSVYPSQQFFGWVFGLGNRVTLISPPNVVEDFKKNISKISKNYK
ncbi:MAG: WYL domain-containing protein [Acutalibacteraceae bacterium]|nr:WYL domain-containing protein [Acutalibacteraceae bacterium]